MIQFGNDKIGEIYVGSDKIKEVYKGEQLVYTAVVDPRSYWVSTGGVKNYFDLENTPINNFATVAQSITINGQSVVKTTIKELVFGESYNSVTSIGNYFTYGCTAMEKIDFRGLVSLRTAGGVFVSEFYYLETLDLSPLISLETIDNQPFSLLYSLNKIKIGSKDYSLVTAPTNGFQNVTNDSDCTIYASTIDLATIFRNKFPNISNWSVAVG